MIKRIIEIIFGVAIAFALMASYAGTGAKSRLLIWYVLTPNVLQVIAWLLLFFLAGRLIFGKYEDYSGFFYRTLVKIFGAPKKTN